MCLTKSPKSQTGMGLVDGARGALGHWIEIKNKRISRYQCVVPSTWNMSPRDDRGSRGLWNRPSSGPRSKMRPILLSWCESSGHSTPALLALFM